MYIVLDAHKPNVQSYCVPSEFLGRICETSSVYLDIIDYFGCIGDISMTHYGESAGVLCIPPKGHWNMLRGYKFENTPDATYAAARSV